MTDGRPTVSGPAQGLLDRYWDYHVEIDGYTPLWDSQIEHVERWPSTSTAHTDAVRERMLAFRDEALALVAEDGKDAPSVRTVADAAAWWADTIDLSVELELSHPDQGLHSFLFWAVNNYPLVTAEHGERYLAKLAAFPAAVDELRERLGRAAREGRAPIARHSRRAVQKLEAHLAMPIAEDPLLEQRAPTSMDEGPVVSWRADLEAAVATHVRPALGRLRDTMRDECLPAGRHDDACGLVHLHGGDETYARALQANTAPGRTPQQVHDTGLEQLERLASEYRELGPRALGLDDLDAIFDRLRDDPDLRFHDAERVVGEATRLFARAEARAPEWFARTPASPCEIRAVEHGSLAFYSRPSADGTRPGVFFFNTADPTVWGPTTLAATVFHEGIPGHHFQLALALEQDGLHDLHRELFLPAFGEGWALYAERLADEIGLYTSDLERLGMLTTDSMRACRLVVDTGIHAFGWSRRRAIEFMRANSPMGDGEITAEVDRYIGMPGQATAYMTGRLEIERLRDETAARLGDRFDLRGFHDRVLSHGMVSLPALRLVVEAWPGHEEGGRP